jgi:hypothetical protein
VFHDKLKQNEKKFNINLTGGMIIAGSMPILNFRPAKTYLHDVFTGKPIPIGGCVSGANHDYGGSGFGDDFGKICNRVK